jgi:glycosyltransferase 2 family protein
MRRLTIVLGIVGLALGTALVAWYGAGSVVSAVLSVGPGGFAVVCAWQMVLFAALGYAWFIVVPKDGGWPVGLIVWARMIRDASGACLPFSQIGGVVFGIRALALHGMPWAVAAASTAADVSAELLAQIGLVGVGAGILFVRSPGSKMTGPLAAGVLVALLLAVLLFWVQRGSSAPLLRLSQRVLVRWRIDPAVQMASLQREMTRIYNRPGLIAACVAMHLVCWLGTGIASWLAFHLLGSDLDLIGALAIEALLHAVLAAAVLVPGYAGVQEAAYIAIGALFGQPPEMALGVSLLRRARDLALGVPILLIWQFFELRHQRRRLVG